MPEGDGWEGDGKPLSQDSGRAAKKRGRSHQDQLIEKGLGCELFTWDSEAYVSVAVDDHKETYAVRSRAFRGWLAAEFYADSASAPGGRAIEDAVRVVAASALRNGPAIEPRVRVAGADERIYIDLADPAWNVVEITSAGWRIVPAAGAPVKFLRPRGLKPLPWPEAGGGLGDLARFVNVAEADLPLLLGVLVAAFRPSGPFPILIVSGEQGSAKTTACRVIKQLIDPNGAPARALPREERDLMIHARNAWMLCFDNISTLPKWLPDALCRIATGGGFGTRMLNTDSDETLFEAMRPIMLNGIPDLASSADLADRAVALTLPRIDAADRRDERRFWAQFERERPFLLGALFGAVVTAIANIDANTVRDAPRMADFALWGAAAAPAFGVAPGVFLERYADNAGGLRAVAIEDDAVAVGIMKLSEVVAAGAVVSAADAEHGEWLGSATELLEEIKSYLPERVTTNARRFPQSPSALAMRARRAAPLLRQKGIIVETGRSGEARFISVRRG